MTLKIKIDRRADAAYVLFQADKRVAKTRELDSQRVVDLDDAGEFIGIEFLAVSQGVDLSELPYRQQLVKLFEDHDIRQLV